MSVAVLWEFDCDNACEGTESNLVVDGARSLAEARRRAKGSGWGRWRNGMEGDFCPNCKGRVGGADHE